MALYEELMNLLSPDTVTRTGAEARMKQLEFTEAYGVYLAELIMNQSFDMALRQLAAVMLTKYVDAHWSTLEKGDEHRYSRNGTHPASPTSAPATSDAAATPTSAHISEQAKKMIRSILPNGLYDPNSKIRTSVAYCISTIAALDWPGQWQELFDIIVKCLGGTECSIHGAMQVLTEFSHDLDTQITAVGPTIMSEVYRIFEADAQYTVKTRTSAVQIIKQLFKSINEHVDGRGDKDRMMLPVLPGLMDKLMAALASQNAQSSSFKLKTEVVKLLTYMANEMQRFIQPYTAQILPTIWQLLTQTADLYVKHIVNAAEGATFSVWSTADGGLGVADTSCDDDDELLHFNTLIVQMIEFIHSLVESGRFKAQIKNVLTDLMYIMIVYMQFTEDQLEDWAEDADRFVDEDYQEQEGPNGSIRIAAQDVLQNIAREVGTSRVLDALSAALARHASVAQAEQAAGSRNWWKIHEASIKAVGGYKFMILDRPQKFDLTAYLNYVRTVMAAGQLDTPYLLGRCLWLLSRFSSSDIYGAQMLEEILTTMQTSLMADKPLNLRIFAVQTVLEVCQSLREAPAERKALVAQRLSAYLDGIVAIIPLGKASLLSLALEAITLMTGFDAGFTAAAHPKIIPLTIAVFLKHHDDPYLLDHVQDILKILCQNPYCLRPLQEKIVPTLVSILNLQGEQSNSAMQEIALDILNTLVKYSDDERLPEQLIEAAFPAAVNCVLRSDDHSIMQSGGECLRAFIYVAPQQVCAYKNGEGLAYVMQIATQLLNPMNAEFSATFVGRLVITIISRAGNLIGDNIYLLLKAVISKMQLVETLSVSMSLVMTFAHLFVTQMEAVLNFLSTVPGPTGEPAIQYVFSNWLSRQHMFYGTYERKVSTMALCKLFEHGVTTEDGRLTAVTIRDAVETVGAETARTRVLRSQASTKVWTNVPILVKIFKLLLSELAHLKEARAGGDLTDDDDEEGDGDEDGDDSESGDRVVMRTSDLLFGMSRE